MSHPATPAPGTRQRQFVFGPERARATILATAAETGGRHDLTDGVLPAGNHPGRHPPAVTRPRLIGRYRHGGWLRWDATYWQSERNAASALEGLSGASVTYITRITRSGAQPMPTPE